MNLIMTKPVSNGIHLRIVMSKFRITLRHSTKVSDLNQWIQGAKQTKHFTTTKVQLSLPCFPPMRQ